MTQRLLICFAVVSLLYGFPAGAQEISRARPLVAQAAGPCVPGLVVFYNSFGPTAADLYSSGNGYYILGNANATVAPGTSEAVSINFHATQNEHLTVVCIPVEYANLGDAATNTFNVTIYTDAKGVPGKPLAGPIAAVTNGNIGICCPIVTVNFPAPGVALKKDAKYWVVADTVAGSTTEAVWDFSYLTEAYNVGAGWAALPNELPAAQILGTVP